MATYSALLINIIFFFLKKKLNKKIVKPDTFQQPEFFPAFLHFCKGDKTITKQILQLQMLDKQIHLLLPNNVGKMYPECKFY